MRCSGDELEGSKEVVVKGGWEVMKPKLCGDKWRLRRDAGGEEGCGEWCSRQW